MSPFNNYQGMREPDPLATFIPWAKTLVAAQPHLAYIHAVEARGAGVSGSDAASDKASPDDKLDDIRHIVQGAGIPFVVCGGYTPETAVAEAEKNGDIVAFGRQFICTLEWKHQRVS